ATLSPAATLTASAVSSSCTIDPTTGAVTGDASIVDGAITIVGGDPIVLESSPAPNTEVTALSPDIASVVLNRQTTGPDGTLTVDAIFITLLNSQTITIASSSCTPTSNEIPMATGKGLLLAGGLLGVAVLGFLVTRRTVLARQHR
ncbi:MAG TPA: choice-of-anchor P family protein, partial [Cryptosporangiaceae bacterium]|nr:choice-of-anchor P family protein [Cryptosporangiaceae bacterium]